MNKYFRRTFIRNDNKEIFLYGYKEHKEAPDKQLEIKNLSNLLALYVKVENHQ